MERIWTAWSIPLGLDPFVTPQHLRLGTLIIISFFLLPSFPLSCISLGTQRLLGIGFKDTPAPSHFRNDRGLSIKISNYCAIVTNVKSLGTNLWVSNVACLGGLRKYMPLHSGSLAYLIFYCSSFLNRQETRDEIGCPNHIFLASSIFMVHLYHLWLICYPLSSQYCYLSSFSFFCSKEQLEFKMLYRSNSSLDLGPFLHIPQRHLFLFPLSSLS